ncbi:alpha/beta hydrolase [Amycolatopsis pithecellobii]|uniref:Alpha/beta hydrolase fold domain-containing protein n=1 Tax=Amycolatopsis pithecellobii TaxID=664692 RepID=A0A6N7Z106_9PSEU|nr:alpha/beta hydrolase [Amycolatopsis pithecellobii]MTD57998.1 alpha/beta hydrolase fold domain-containing protein [Amycolatopsis pithecellobii]
MSKEQRAKVDAMMREPRPASRSVDEWRAGFMSLQSRNLVPEGVRTSEATLGDRRALLIEPSEAVRPGTILYFHGGGYVLGAPETSLSITANLVVRSAIRSLSLDYRLAPENPFPAAVDDCVNAYRTLLDSEDSGPVALAGDSAGGGLAVATALVARDLGLPVPAAITTFSAGLDLTLTGASMETKAGIDPLFTKERLQPFLDLYCAGQDLKTPLLSPALFADLAGFPPVLLQSGANEVLLDDATRFAARALDAGVEVILDVTADVPHVFQAFAGILDEADNALARAALFLAQHLDTDPALVAARTSTNPSEVTVR